MFDVEFKLVGNVVEEPPEALSHVTLEYHAPIFGRPHDVVADVVNACPTCNPVFLTRHVHHLIVIIFHM
jgi:hypothetical protein